MFKKIYSKLKNYINGENHWEYSLSISSFIVGILLFILVELRDNTFITILSSIMLLLGVYALPNFKASYMDAFAKGTLKFTIAATFTVFDIILIINITRCLISNQNIPPHFFVMAAIFTFLLFRYYIDISYKVVVSIAKEITEKKRALKKSFKLVLSLISFLTTLVPIANCMYYYIKLLS